MMLLQVCEHFIEVSSPAHLGGFDVFEFPYNDKALACRILTQQANLGRDAESFRFLILARHPYVDHYTSRLMRRRARGRSGQGQSSRRHGTSHITRSRLIVSLLVFRPQARRIAKKSSSLSFATAQSASVRARPARESSAARAALSPDSGRVSKRFGLWLNVSNWVFATLSRSLC